MIPAMPQTPLPNYLREFVGSNHYRKICVNAVAPILRDLYHEIKIVLGANTHHVIEGMLGTSMRLVYYQMRDEKAISIEALWKFANLWKNICRKSGSDFSNLWQVISANVRGFTVGGAPNVTFLPKMLTPRLAYFLGVLFGDGSLSSGDKRYAIKVDDETEFLPHFIKKLSAEMFGVSGTVVKDRNGHSWSCNSKVLHIFLNEIFQMPVGKKKGLLAMPKSIKGAPLGIQKWFIVGLMDSDGSVAGSKNPNASPRLELRLSCLQLLIDIKEALRKFGIYIGGPYLHAHDGSALIATTSLRQIRKYAMRVGFLYPNKVKLMRNILESY